MRINIEPYTSTWAIQFESIKAELSILLTDFDPVIEHFGSTAVPGLAAKPVIDILVGIQDTSQFGQVVTAMLKHKSYIYYEAFNPFMPERRLFVRLKDEIPVTKFENIFSELENIPHDRINECRLSHVHVWQINSEDWIRHIAFREYLKCHEEIMLQYENLKKELSQKDWENGMKYNDGKDAFIKEQEKKAIAWYLGTK